MQIFKRLPKVYRAPHICGFSCDGRPALSLLEDMDQGILAEMTMRVTRGGQWRVRPLTGQQHT